MQSKAKLDTIIQAVLYSPEILIHVNMNEIFRTEQYLIRMTTVCSSLRPEFLQLKNGEESDEQTCLQKSFRNIEEVPKTTARMELLTEGSLSCLTRPSKITFDHELGEGRQSKL